MKAINCNSKNIEQINLKTFVFTEYCVEEDGIDNGCQLSDNYPQVVCSPQEFFVLNYSPVQSLPGSGWMALVRDQAGQVWSGKMKNEERLI